MNKTKIDIISGFLGAGKTTFIKKLIREVYVNERVVILENEFGRINIDEETLGREGLTVKPVQAGCICCSGSADLTGGILEIIREYQPERIVIEPTGIAKLSEIKKILSGGELNAVFEPGHIITIVDARNYYERTMISKEFFEDQIRASGVIFLSKTDQMEEEKLTRVMKEINRLQPNCRVACAAWDNITPEQLAVLIKEKQDSAKIKRKITIRQKQVNDFDRYEIVKEECFDMEQMKLFLHDAASGIYGEIHRVKGICRDSGQGLYSIDYLPGETVLKPIQKATTGAEPSRVCLIGRLLEKERLDKSFRQNHSLS